MKKQQDEFSSQFLEINGKILSITCSQNLLQKNIDKTINNQNRKNVEFEKNFKSLQNEIKSKDGQINSFKKKIKSLEKENKSLKSEVKTLNTKINSIEKLLVGKIARALKQKVVVEKTPISKKIKNWLAEDD